MAEFSKMREVIDIAPQMAAEKKLKQHKKILSYRIVTLARGVQLDSSLNVVGNLEAEIVIFDEIRLDENVLYCFKYFECETVKQSVPKKIKLVSTPPFLITPVKTFENHFKETKRATNTIETLERYKDGIPIHGEIDLIAILDSIQAVNRDNSNNEFVVNVRSMANQLKPIRMIGTPKVCK